MDAATRVLREVDQETGEDTPQPAERTHQCRSQRDAGIGLQMGSHLSRNGLSLLVPEDKHTPKEHAEQALSLEHPFAVPPDIPLDVKFAAVRSSEDCRGTALLRGKHMLKLVQLANMLLPWERMIQARICSSVKVASGSLRLAFITALTFLIRWPDWQLTSLMTRGFRVAGLIEPSNVYPRIAPAAVGPFYRPGGSR